MNSLKVNCPHCGQPLEVPASMAHDTCVCPTCKGHLKVESLAGEFEDIAARPQIVIQPEPRMPQNGTYCGKCGARLEDNVLFCPKCGSRRQNASGAETYNDRDSRSFENESSVVKTDKIQIDETISTAPETSRLTLGNGTGENRDGPKQEREIMFCKNCGNQIADAAVVCTKCGVPVAGKYPAANAMVKNHMVEAILTTVICCVPFGIVAIVYASQVNTKLAQGDIEGAKSASKKAIGWIIASVIVGAIAGIIYVGATMLGME